VAPSCWPRCGGGFCGDDGCTPSLGLSVDTEELSSVARDSDSPLVMGRSEATRGLSQARVGWGLHRGWVMPVTAWPAGWPRWTALIGQLPMGVHGSHGPYVEPGSTASF